MRITKKMLNFAPQFTSITLKTQKIMKKNFNFRENSNVVRNENIERYRIEMERYKVLSEDEVRDLIAKAQNGNERARTKVINANLRIVWSIAASYNGLDHFEDILQNGNIGLCKAVDTLDLTKGVLFQSWIAEYVRKYITIGLTNESRVVRLPKHRQGEVNIGVSMDAPIGSDEDGDKTLLDTFASHLTADNFSEVEHYHHIIKRLLNGLNERDRAIVCKLFGIGCREYTQYELSLQYGCTEERIRQIKVSAIEKMAELA